MSDSDPSSGPPPSATPESPLPPKAGPPPARQGAAWANPFARLDAAWTSLESALCAGVLVAEITALCGWILLKGLSTPSTADSKAGMVFRAVLGAVGLGLIAYVSVRRRWPAHAAWITSIMALAGAIACGAIRDLGTSYFSNVLNWLQDASALALAGGLRGVGTRLTVWLAMLGGSLAAGSGKHINIDVVMRFLRPRARVPAAVLAWTVTAVVCVTAAWAFTDHITVESFDAPKSATASEKLSTVWQQAGQGWFLLRKQVALDISTLPRVIAGRRYDGWLTNAEWNRRVDEGGWASRFGEEKAAGLKAPEESGADLRAPMVVLPGGTARGVLVHLLNLVFPIGFLFIAARFLLRALLAASGHVSVDPDASHAEELTSSAAKGQE